MLFVSRILRNVASKRSSTFEKVPSEIQRLLSTTFQSKVTFDEQSGSQNQTQFIHQISVDEYCERRKNVAKKLAQFVARERINPDVSPSKAKANHLHILIIPSAQKRYMVEKIPYFFRQSTDMRYLTGHLGPDSVLILRIDLDNNGDHHLQSTLFLPDSNAKEEKWEGNRIKPEDAASIYGVDSALRMSEFSNFLRRFQTEEKHFRLWFDYLNPTHTDIHRTVMDFVQDSDSLASQSVESPRKIIHELRLRKSDAEIQLMRKSCSIGSSAIRETIRATPNLRSEAEAFATVDYQCRMNGADYLAYPPVVAYGDHANTIHYTKNSGGFFDRSEMILMDAGCEYKGYTSDITRVWPVSGKFSPVQKLVYEAVLNVQQELITILEKHEDLITVDWLYHQMQEVLGQHLVRLGLVKAGLSEIELKVACSEYCPHHVSHYLGMDVHDTAQVPRNIPLQPGMVITVEPGLYIPRSSKFLPTNRSEFAGIGIRIEDDVLITVKENKQLSCEVLSSSCPKTVIEIEELMTS